MVGAKSREDEEKPAQGSGPQELATETYPQRYAAGSQFEDSFPGPVLTIRSNFAPTVPGYYLKARI